MVCAIKLAPLRLTSAEVVSSILHDVIDAMFA